MNKSENIGDLALALSKAQSQLNGAAKTSDNPFFKSKYADLHECIEAAKEALSKNELAVVQTTDTDEQDRIWVYTTLMHSSGQWIQGKIRMKPKKDDDQATGSSITYGRRYGFAAIVGLAQKDDDGNESGDVGNQKKPENKGQKQPENKRQTPPQNTEILDKWLAWVDAFSKPGATLDSFTAECDKYAEAIKKLPAADQAKINIAKKEMTTFLMERQQGVAA